MNWPLAMFVAGAGAALAQRSSPVDLAPATFLVAQEKLPDQNFAETVILLIDYSKKGAMGLIINRPAKLRLNEVVEGAGSGAAAKEPVFRGGPVIPGGVMALVRSPQPLKEARAVFGDVYLVTTRDTLAQFLDRDTATLRVFLGYSGWGPGQLDNEMRFDSWHVFGAEAATVFDPNPAAVWPRLIRRVKMQFAFVRPGEGF